MHWVTITSGCVGSRGFTFPDDFLGGALVVIFARLLVLVLVPVHAGWSAEPVANKPLALFLLVGQSNMAGRGQLSEQDQTPPERVVTLAADDSWVPAVDPIHFDKPKVAGVGLGRSFGIAVADHCREDTVGLIPCGVGGSPIDAWTPGAHYPPTDSHPYDDAVRRAQRAMRDGTLRGILWHQGESDSQAGLAEAYQRKLHQLIHRLREQLDAADVPFIVGQMGQFPERPWSDAKRAVDRAHRRLPMQVARTAFVGSDGLVHGGDQVHFDAESYRVFGRRYAQAYFSLVPPPGCVSGEAE